jgi:hypothetical protein
MTPQYTLYHIVQFDISKLELFICFLYNHNFAYKVSFTDFGWADELLVFMKFEYL